MSEIKVEHEPTAERLAELGVFGWPVWTKEVSEFPWFYDEQEVCYFLAGEIEVTPETGDAAPVKAGKGDLVTFPKGLSCTWKVLADVRKHYRFG